MDSTAGRPSRRRSTKPLRPLVHAIEATTLRAGIDDITVLLRDGRQYYVTSIPRKALGRLANQEMVDIDDDSQETEAD